MVVHPVPSSVDGRVAPAGGQLRIGDNARRTAEAYTWERNAAAVWEFLNEVASKKQA